MLMRMGLSTLFTATKDMEIVGEAIDGRQAVQLADKLKPDVILMDLMMPEMNGAEATRVIHEAHPEIKIIILTTFGTSVELLEAVKNGAVATLMKDTAAKELVKSIRSVIAGNPAESGIDYTIKGAEQMAAMHTLEKLPQDPAE